MIMAPFWRRVQDGARSGMIVAQGTMGYFQHEQSGTGARILIFDSLLLLLRYASEDGFVQIFPFVVTLTAPIKCVYMVDPQMPQVRGRDEDYIVHRWGRDNRENSPALRPCGRSRRSARRRKRSPRVRSKSLSSIMDSLRRPAPEKSSPFLALTPCHDMGIPPFDNCPSK